MRSAVSPYLLAGLACLLGRPAAADGPPAAAGAAACGGEPFRFSLSDPGGRLYDSVEAVSRAKVVLVYYQGFSSKDVLENVREALKNDPVVGKDTPLGEQWAGFAIIDYKEGWFVPAWAIDKALREKMAKHPKAVFLQDRGECLTKDGTSEKCPGGRRTPHFKSGQGSLAVLYRGHLVKKFAGRTDAGRVVDLMRKLTVQGQKGASYCEAKQAVGW
jgi:hypothetical protein